MPRITRQLDLEITPERFLEACSVTELIELQLLLDSPRFQSKITAEKRQIKLFSNNDHVTNQAPTN